jgi:aspartyl-tRNA(Asn)/glutamyl-tRNA(Gln) amidotransferase subunit A
MRLTRRGFTKLCGSAVVANGLLQAWPIEADTLAPTDVLTSKSLTEISAMVHTKTVTPTQLVQALLDRIAVINPKVNAYVTVMGAQALAQAKVLDAEQKSASSAVRCTAFRSH